MLTDSALYAIRCFLRDSIAFARYKVNDTYYEAPIHAAEVLLDGRVAIAFMIDYTEAEIVVVEETQLCGHDGAVWAIKAEDIIRSEVQEGILYRFYFTVKEAA